MAFKLMVVTSDLQNDPKRGGVSLLITMSALVILSTLAITTTHKMLTPTYVATSASRLVIEQNEYRSALQVLRQVVRLAAADVVGFGQNQPALDGRTYSLSFNGRQHTYNLQDVNGLIDVNSASSSLMSALLNGLGQAESIDMITTRRSTAPFTSNQEFIQLLNVDPQTRALIVNLVTIHSGQRRISGQTAPIELLQILSGTNSNRAQMIAYIDSKFLRTRPVTKVVVRVSK